MAKIWVTDLTDGQEFSAPFQVRSRQQRTHRSRSGSFMTLVLGDRTGEVNAVAWEDADRFYPFTREGSIVHVRGRCQLYNGDVQVVVEHVSPTSHNDYQLADFLPSSPRDAATMGREFRAEVNSVRHRGLRALLEATFDRERYAQFALAPAATQIHHAYLGGLLERTLEVVRLCRAQFALHPEMDGELLITAALLHDIGKVREYNTAAAFEETDEGGLLGHIPIADALLAQLGARIPELSAELLVRLRHMLLSHHGRHEWRSPQLPKTLEAVALHLADYTSCQLAIFAAALLQVERPGNWSGYHRTLERKLYAAPKATGDFTTTLREASLTTYPATSRPRSVRLR
ncbi:MAG: 3'-5' exoribonuclease YhaM family protein [Chloroflexota bacterium]